MAVSAEARVTRADFSRSACACRLIASCSEAGIATSRISTERTPTPQLPVLAAMVMRSCSSAVRRSDSRRCRSVAPIISRRLVCATRSIASR